MPSYGRNSDDPEEAQTTNDGVHIEFTDLIKPQKILINRITINGSG